MKHKTDIGSGTLTIGPPLRTMHPIAWDSDEFIKPWASGSLGMTREAEARRVISPASEEDVRLTSSADLLQETPYGRMHTALEFVWGKGCERSGVQTDD